MSEEAKIRAWIDDIDRVTKDIARIDDLVAYLSRDGSMAKVKAESDIYHVQLQGSDDADHLRARLVTLLLDHRQYLDCRRAEKVECASETFQSEP